MTAKISFLRNLRATLIKRIKYGVSVNINMKLTKLI